MHSSTGTAPTASLDKIEEELLALPREAREHLAKVLASSLGDDEVEMGRHGAKRMHLETVEAGRDREEVHQELVDGRVGAEEQVPAEGATGVGGL